MLVILCFFLFQISFRFFFWLMCMEIIMVKMIFFSSLKKKSTMYMCSLLVLGACEVSIALSMIVTVSRFSGLEKTSNLQCEGF